MMSFIRFLDAMLRTCEGCHFLLKNLEVGKAREGLQVSSFSLTFLIS
jgi:hypothetical protein